MGFLSMGGVMGPGEPNGIRRGQHAQKPDSLPNAQMLIIGAGPIEPALLLILHCNEANVYVNKFQF